MPFQGSRPTWKSGKTCTNCFIFPVREFEKNASNLGEIVEFDWPKRESGQSVIRFILKYYVHTDMVKKV